MIALTNLAFVVVGSFILGLIIGSVSEVINEYIEAKNERT